MRKKTNESKNNMRNHPYCPRLEITFMGLHLTLKDNKSDKRATGNRGVIVWYGKAICHTTSYRARNVLFINFQKISIPSPILENKLFKNVHNILFNMHGNIETNFLSFI